MVKIFTSLWQDDDGAIISSEFLFIATILIIGIIPGLVALRNGIVVELTELSNAIAQTTGSGSTCPAPVCIDPGAPSDINVSPCN